MSVCPFGVSIRAQRHGRAVLSSLGLGAPAAGQAGHVKHDNQARFSSSGVCARMRIKRNMLPCGRQQAGVECALRGDYA